MSTQPDVKLRLPAIFNRICKLGHDVFAAKPKMKGILKNKNVEHPLDERRIIRPTSHVLHILSVKPRAQPLVINRKGLGAEDAILPESQKKRSWNFHTNFAHPTPIYSYIISSKCHIHVSSACLKRRPDET